MTSTTINILVTGPSYDENTKEARPGKSFLCQRIKGNDWQYMTESTKNFKGLNFVKKNTERNNIIYTIQLCDESGRKSSSSSMEYHIRNKSIAFYCINLTSDLLTEEQLQKYWGAHLERAENYNKNVTTILVGTHYDVKKNLVENNHNLLKKFSRHNNLAYIETSAKDGTGINELLEQSIKSFEAAQNPSSVTADKQETSGQARPARVSSINPSEQNPHPQKLQPSNFFFRMGRAASETILNYPKTTAVVSIIVSISMSAVFLGIMGLIQAGFPIIAAAVALGMAIGLCLSVADVCSNTEKNMPEINR